MEKLVQLLKDSLEGTKLPDSLWLELAERIDEHYKLPTQPGVSEVVSKILDGRKEMISEMLDELLSFVCDAGGQDDIDTVRYWNATYFEQLNK